MRSISPETCLGKRSFQHTWFLKMWLLAYTSSGQNLLKLRDSYKKMHLYLSKQQNTIYFKLLVNFNKNKNSFPRRHCLCRCPVRSFLRYALKPSFTRSLPLQTPGLQFPLVCIKTLLYEVSVVADALFAAFIGTRKKSSSTRLFSTWTSCLQLHLEWKNLYKRQHTICKMVCFKHIRLYDLTT